MDAAPLLHYSTSPLLHFFLKGIAMLKITVMRPAAKKLLKHFRTVCRMAYVRALKDWRAGTLPAHFKLGAAKRYGYFPRTKKYQARKRRNKHGAPALVYSGDSRRAMIASRRAPETPSRRTAKQRVVLKIPAERYFFYKFKRPKTGGQWPWRMADEVARIRPDEVKKLADGIEADITDGFFRGLEREKLTF